MNAGLRALLTGVIDYAGLFPPAELPLDEAFSNYLGYREGPDVWMLGRFVCPVDRLAELGPFPERPATAGPVAVAAISRGRDGVPSSRPGPARDLEPINAFRKRHGDAVRVDALEIRLPPELLLAPSESSRTAFANGIREVRAAGLAPFCEATSGEVAPLLSEAGAGYKLRCGGLEGSAIPPPERVAAVITACRDAGVPLKFTAGLHHPLRRHDPGLGTLTHGFINVFAAGVLAHARGLPPAPVQQIIDDEDPTHFAFDDAGLRWNDLRASTEAIRTARQQFVVSFGSCSFDEPRDDLPSLGWL